MSLHSGGYLSPPSAHCYLNTDIWKIQFKDAVLNISLRLLNCVIFLSHQKPLGTVFCHILQTRPLSSFHLLILRCPRHISGVSPGRPPAFERLPVSGGSDPAPVFAAAGDHSFSLLRPCPLRTSRSPIFLYSHNPEAVPGSCADTGPALL